MIAPPTPEEEEEKTRSFTELKKEVLLGYSGTVVDPEVRQLAREYLDESEGGRFGKKYKGEVYGLPPEKRDLFKEELQKEADYRKFTDTKQDKGAFDWSFDAVVGSLSDVAANAEYFGKEFLGIADDDIDRDRFFREAEQLRKGLERPESFEGQVVYDAAQFLVPSLLSAGMDKPLKGAKYGARYAPQIAFWETQMAPDSYDQLVAEGADPNATSTKLAAGVAGALSSAIEVLVEKPSRMLGLDIDLAKMARGKVAGLASDYLKSTGKELSEEVMQAIVQEATEEVLLGEDNAFWRDALDINPVEMAKAVATVAVMGGPGRLAKLPSAIRDDRFVKRYTEQVEAAQEAAQANPVHIESKPVEAVSEPPGKVGGKLDPTNISGFLDVEGGEQAARYLVGRKRKDGFVSRKGFTDNAGLRTQNKAERSRLVDAMEKGLEGRKPKAEPPIIERSDPEFEAQRQDLIDQIVEKRIEEGERVEDVDLNEVGAEVDSYLASVEPSAGISRPQPSNPETVAESPRASAPGPQAGLQSMLTSPDQDIAMAQPSPGLQALSEAAGVEVRVVTSSQPLAQAGAFDPQEPGVVYVDGSYLGAFSSPVEAVQSVAMHEIVHNMRQESPDVYDQLSAAIQRLDPDGYAQAREDYLARLQERSQLVYDSISSREDEVREEATGHYLESNVSKLGVLTKLAKEDYSSWEKTVGAVRRLVQKTGDRGGLTKAIMTAVESSGARSKGRRIVRPEMPNPEQMPAPPVSVEPEMEMAAAADIVRRMVLDGAEKREVVAALSDAGAPVGILQSLDQVIDLAKRPRASLRKTFPKGEPLSLTARDQSFQQRLRLQALNDYSNDRKAGVIRKFLRHFFTAQGDMPKTVHDEYLRSKAWQEGALVMADAHVRMFEKGVAKDYGKKLDDLTVDTINDALDGSSAAIARLKPNTRVSVQLMRDHIDEMSSVFIDEGLVEGDLKSTIDANRGIYLTRAYKAHHEPKWAEALPEDVRNRAAAHIRSALNAKAKSLRIKAEKLARKGAEPEVIDVIEMQAEQAENTDAHTVVADLLYYHNDAVFGGFNRGGKVGSKDLGILRQRKELAPVISELLGEYTDPKARYAQTIAKQATLLSNHQFLENLKDLGEGQFIFHKDDISHDDPERRRGPEFNYPLAGKASESFSPLNGYMTTPEIGKALEEVMASEPLPWWVRLLAAGNAYTKAGKTVLNPMTHARNVQGNFFFHMRNGHVIRGKDNAALFIGRAIELLSSNSPAARAELQELVRAGVIHESVTLGDVQELAKDYNDLGDLNKYTESRIKRRMKAGFRAAAKLYQKEDDFSKIIAFYSEMANYKERMLAEGKTMSEVTDYVAKIVRNTNPTYSLVPKFIKRIRHAPFANFVSFFWETLRTQYHSMKQIQEDWQNGYTDLVARRIAGQAAAHAMSYGMGKASLAMLGMTWDDEDDLREFLPPWSRNNPILWLGGKDAANMWYFDLGYMDPSAAYMGVARAILRGEMENKPEYIEEAVAHWFQALLGEDLLTSAILDVMRNKKKMTGGEVYTEADTMWGKAEDVMAHLLKAMEPGVSRGARDMVKGFFGEADYRGIPINPWATASKQLTGWKLERLSLVDEVQFNSPYWKRSIDNTKRLLKDLKTKGKLDVDEIPDIVERFNDAYIESYYRLVDKMMAARRQGVSVFELDMALEAAGISETDRFNFMFGIYKEYTPPKGTYSDMAFIRRPEGAPEGGEFIKRELEVDMAFLRDLKRNFKEAKRRVKTSKRE